MSQALQSERPTLDVDRRPDGPGVTHIDSTDPAAPMYQLLARLRKPVALRDIMIRPVREGYAGQDLPDVATVLPPWEHLFPGQMVSELRVQTPEAQFGAGSIIPMPEQCPDPCWSIATGVGSWSALRRTPTT